jgi:hypothetical protein
MPKILAKPDSPPFYHILYLDLTLISDENCKGGEEDDNTEHPCSIGMEKAALGIITSEE